METKTFARLRAGELQTINGLKRSVKDGELFEFEYNNDDEFFIIVNGKKYSEVGTAFDFVTGWIAIEELKRGDFFKKKQDAKKVWVKGDYNRFSKKYESADFDDCLQNFCQLKKGTLVFIDFEF